ncbi:hypothetical protein FOQG_16645 [Fusarium oxysporum f. sp. raphani 54005]|uniref:Uncharacterized protein n=1 Tax=Fusarium oxysporum f. sp. raphani 54005 TaxID=1089458 RepID=X0BJT1_FUSOX|nr:hypothetical protein FOQG_16645 [Fusarium oxysporum f. sp. raphani 54005]
MMHSAAHIVQYYPLQLSCVLLGSSCGSGLALSVRLRADRPDMFSLRFSESAEDPVHLPQPSWTLTKAGRVRT